MKHLLNITASIDKPGLLANMIEKIASRRYDIGYINERMSNGWKAIETASSEIYVNGAVEFMFNDNECTRMPFISSFLFTCMHSNNEPYELVWGMSLS